MGAVVKVGIGCVMLLTLFRYEGYWSDSESLMSWCITALGLIAIGVTILQKQSIRWSFVDQLVALYSLYLFVNAIFVSHSPLAHQLLMIGECVVLYVFVRIITANGGNVSPTMACLMAIAGTYESMVGLIQLVGLKGAYSDTLQVTGTFCNSGPLGIYIAVMLSLCTCYYLRTHNRIIGLSMIVMLMGLSSTWSRSAWLAYAIVLVLLFRNFFIKHWRITLLLVVGIIAVLYLIKQESADSRMLMNIVAFKEWTSHPWCGHGLGGYVHALAHGQMDFFLTNPNSAYIACVGATNLAFNEYLRVMLEQGLVGLVFMLSRLGLSFFRLYRKHSPLFYAMFALCLAALFSYPFHLYPFSLLITMFVALAANGETDEVKTGIGKKVAMSVCLVITLGLSVLMNYEIDRRVEKSNEARRIAFMHDVAFIDDYYELLPWMIDNREFLFHFGKTLREAGRYNDSNAILRMETELDTDPMAYVVMGRNYEDMNLYDEADSLYFQAFLLQPNRIYPLYRQMKLYEKIGDDVRKNKKACELLSFTPKVMSPAVKDMKNEARKILVTR